MVFQHALVVGKFAPLHKGHQFLIESALAGAARVTVLCYANPDFPTMPGDVRAAWIRRLYPQVQVAVPHSAPPDAAAGPVHWAFLSHWLQCAGVTPDVVFSSEHYGPPFAAALGVQHRMVDLARACIPVSATRLRADLHGQRQWLAPGVYRHFVQRVALLGAESTGKSALAAELAARAATQFVPEIGRDVWQARGGQLVPDDYVDIAQRQRAAEDAALDACQRFLFVDTNALTTLLLGFCYGHLREAPALLAQYADECGARYAHHFLCGDEIPFEQDGWRMDAGWRAEVQALVRADLLQRGVRYASVAGTLDERAQRVLAYLQE